MFNLRFVSHYDDGSSCEHNHACHHYCVYKRTKNGVTDIILYPDSTINGGVEWCVVSDKAAKKLSLDESPKMYMHICYVMNEKNDTIDVIK